MKRVRDELFAVAGARLISHPGVARFNIGHFRGHPKPIVTHFLNPHFDRFDRGCEVRPAIRRPVRAGGGVAIVEQIDAFVISKECLAGMKACC